MSVLYVASDSEGAGKTAVCATLAHMLRALDRKVAVFKPVAAADLMGRSDPDTKVYADLLGQQADGWPAELPEGGLSEGLLKEISAAFARVSGEADVLVVEASCALTIEESARVAEELDARTLVVGTFHRDLSASQMAPWTEHFGDRLLGVLINGLTRYLGTETNSRMLPSMNAAGLASFGVIPEDRRLLGVSVTELAKHLDGRFIVREEHTDALVEHIMVGGMGMDPGELYFGLRESKAVIVRGDRPDIQMPALNTNMSCMVLTGGFEPIEYVKYEAEQEEVAVMVVQTDTLTTMAAVNTLSERARFDHPLKLSRFSEMLEEHANLPALFDGLGLRG